MLGSPVNGTALPNLRRNSVRHVAGARDLARGLAAQPSYFYLLWRNPARQSVRRSRSAFPAPAAAASQPAIQGQTCLGCIGHYRSGRRTGFISSPTADGIGPETAKVGLTLFCSAQNKSIPWTPKRCIVPSARSARLQSRLRCPRTTRRSRCPAIEATNFAAASFERWPCLDKIRCFTDQGRLLSSCNIRSSWLVSTTKVSTCRMRSRASFGA